MIASLAATHLVGAQPASAPNLEADAAYREARRLYDLREWEGAIAKFKEAYRLRPDAPSLFNIAQANRLRGDCAEALSFYKTYKRNFPAAKNIDKVDHFITEMEGCTNAVKVEPAAVVTPAPVETVPTTPIATPSTEDPGRTKRVAGIVIGGAGVVSLGVSLAFGLRARSAASDAETAMTGDTWNPQIQARGHAAVRDSEIALAIGTAAIITGGLLYVLGREHTSEASHVAVVPEHQGASLVWASDF